MIDHLQELLDIGADTVHPVLATELVIHLKPSYSQIASGWVGQHGILVPTSSAEHWPMRILRIGVLGTGWATVDTQVSCKTLPGLFREAYLPEPFPADEVGAATWALEANGCVWWPITGWNLLPAHMVLSEYDVGHRVILTRGEQMGRAGVVMSGHSLSREAYEVAFDAVEGEHRLPAARSWVTDSAMAVILDDEPERLAPLAVRFPAGSPVWVMVRVRGGQPMSWVKATALYMQDGCLNAMRHDTSEERCYTRDQVADGHEPPPPDGPVALTAKGTRPAPKVRKRKDWSNVPKAK